MNLLIYISTKLGLTPENRGGVLTGIETFIEKIPRVKVPVINPEKGVFQEGTKFKEIASARERGISFATTVAEGLTAVTGITP